MLSLSVYGAYLVSEKFYDFVDEWGFTFGALCLSDGGLMRWFWKLFSEALRVVFFRGKDDFTVGVATEGFELSLVKCWIAGDRESHAVADVMCQSSADASA